MSGGEYGPGPGFTGSFGGMSRLGSGQSDQLDMRGHRPQHSRGNFPPGGPDSWSSSEGRELGSHMLPGEAGSWGGLRETSMMPLGGTGRPPSMMGDGRSRGGFGRGPEFQSRGRFGRGGFGRGHWSSNGDFEGRGFEGRGWGPGEQLMLGDRSEFARGGFRGRADFARGRGGRFGGGGGRPGFEGRGRRDGWGEEGPREPDLDPALLERRRESTAALVRRQVAQLQVSRGLLGEDEAADVYSRIMEAETDVAPQADVRGLLTYPMFSASEAGAAPALSTPEEASAAFEHCLQLYQDVQEGHTVVQSEHGNFLLPVL